MEDEFERAYTFFARKTKKKVRNVEYHINYHIKELDNKTEKFHKIHTKDLNDKINLRYKHKMTQISSESIKMFRKKLRKIRGY